MTSISMKTSLRVLTAISENNEPDPADIKLLRKLASPEQSTLDPAELAGIEINAALERRKGNMR